VHKIASANEDTLEFVSSVGDCVTVQLTEDERRELLGQSSAIVSENTLDSSLVNVTRIHFLEPVEAV
jgi:hypothetical protein